MLLPLTHVFSESMHSSWYFGSVSPFNGPLFMRVFLLVTSAHRDMLADAHDACRCVCLMREREKEDAGD